MSFRLSLYLPNELRYFYETDQLPVTHYQSHDIEVTGSEVKINAVTRQCIQDFNLEGHECFLNLLVIFHGHQTFCRPF